VFKYCDQVYIHTVFTILTLLIEWTLRQSIAAKLHCHVSWYVFDSIRRSIWFNEGWGTGTVTT